MSKKRWEQDSLLISRHQEQNNRELLSRYGTLCARLMKHWHDRQTFTEPGVAQSGALRVGIVSAHIRDHSVWTTIIKGWLQNFDRDRFEFHLFHVGSKHDEETAWAQSRSTSFEHGAKSCGSGLISSWRNGSTC
jgi:predicted O-linked N-acetylglucosamine transferase (SPINDLY family)